MHTHPLTGSTPVYVVLLVLALVSFVIAQFPPRPVPVPVFRINWVALGLTFWVLTLLLGYLHL